MADAETRMFELALAGYGCSQLLVQLALDARGGDGPDLLRAVSGLHGGVGQSGKLCGALTGGACALALQAAQPPGAGGDARLDALVRALADWFDGEIGRPHGGSDCAQILDGDDRNRLARCPPIVLAVHRKVEELLAARGPEEALADGSLA